MTSRAGRLLVLGYEGAVPPEDLYAFAARCGLGGVILFARNCPDAAAVRAATRELRRRLAEADPGGNPLVMVDQEGGRVERIRDAVPFLPPARELGTAGPDALAERVEAQARALAALGIDVNLAPVCDVLAPGESGAVGDRSFGSDPALVAALAAAHVGATLRGGVLPCAKHFPGHGAARVDSHRELPVIRGDPDGAEHRDLPPFRAAVAAGVPLVMPGHLVFPPVDDRPASLSPVWLGRVLRGRLGFGGAVISDDLEMGALAGFGPPERVARAAVEAGCDLLVFGRMLRADLDPWAVAGHLEAHLAPGRLAEALGRAARLRPPPGPVPEGAA